MEWFMGLSPVIQGLVATNIYMGDNSAWGMFSIFL